MNTQYIEDLYQLPTYVKFPLVIDKGKGSYVWDKKGTKYLDFYGGHAVALLGHCHPAIIQAVTKQVKELIFYSNVVYNTKRAQAVQKLIKITNGSYTSVFLCNSGTEANETAIKLAKKYTDRDEVISFVGDFHGRTIGSLSVTGFEKYKKHMGSMINAVKFATFGDIESVKNLISPNTAAVILEPIQSIAGINEAPKEFYIELKKLCEKHNIILIFDEVQTGLGRTGAFLYSEHYGITPDMTTLAKGLASGLPVGAVLINEKITKSVQIEDQGSTFGGGPVICVAMLATLQAIGKKNLATNAKKLGKLIKTHVSKLPHIKTFHGKGLLLGIEFDIEAKKVQKALLEAGIITGTSANPHVLRLMPPLTINKKDVELFIKTLSSVLNRLTL